MIVSADRTFKLAAREPELTSAACFHIEHFTAIPADLIVVNIREYRSVFLKRREEDDAL